MHEFTDTWAARRNSGSGHETAADAGLGLLLGGRTTACDPHALVGGRCGGRRGPDLKHSTTRAQDKASQEKAFTSPAGRGTLTKVNSQRWQVMVGLQERVQSKRGFSEVATGTGQVHDQNGSSWTRFETDGRRAAELRIWQPVRVDRARAQLQDLGGGAI